jgi:hypothetical protein
MSPRLADIILIAAKNSRLCARNRFASMRNSARVIVIVGYFTSGLGFVSPDIYEVSFCEGLTRSHPLGRELFLESVIVYRLGKFLKIGLPQAIDMDDVPELFRVVRPEKEDVAVLVVRIGLNSDMLQFV